MIKRLFSKRSGFTLVEIIVAFAVFAIMAAMIVQILDLVSWQRRSNTEYANGLDEQEQYLVTHDKKPYNKDDTSKDKELALNFGDENFKFNYQMYGANDSGDPNGLSYYVSKEGERAQDIGGDDGGDDEGNDNNNNTGAQTDRMDARITGTKGFDYIGIKRVVPLGQDEDGNYRYALEVCANGVGMFADDVPYANYRLIFPAEIVEGYYLNVGNNTDLKAAAENEDCKVKFGTGAANSSPDPENKYVVSLTSPKGIRIGSPFSNPQVGGWVWKCDREGCPNTAQYKHELGQCKKPSNPWYDSCSQHCHEEYVEPSDWQGNGVRFSENNCTKIELVFKTDPGITEASFGENGVEQTGSTAYHYSANSTIAGGINTGLNIYGAYPKK